MNCPSCNEPMKVTHTYRVPGGTTHSLECACGLKAVSETVIVEVDPRYGNGAAARARRLHARTEAAGR